MKNTSPTPFRDLAEAMLHLLVGHRVNSLGGYGPGGEVIYENHPAGCPSSLTSSIGNAVATFLSNGSVDFEVTMGNGLPVHVLDSSFDIAEKRATGMPSCDAWIQFSASNATAIASLINPCSNLNMQNYRIKIIKTGDPDRAIWYCAYFDLPGGGEIHTAVRMRLYATSSGPALARDIFVKNSGRVPVPGNLWTNYNLKGTQRFPYHKPLWYDAGMPITSHDTVTAAVMPHEEILQIKWVSAETDNCAAVESTCDYSLFVGNTGTFSLMPEAVVQGKLLEGERERLNRFATPSISASRYSFELAPEQSAQVCQNLLLVCDESLTRRFRELSVCSEPGYLPLERAFRTAALDLIDQIRSREKTGAALREQMNASPFEISLPALPSVSAYINSTWTGVQELYEKCRAHGAVLADGIEIGTRDRCQDMWAKMKEDPARVRADLVHAMSFMYIIPGVQFDAKEKLTLAQKLHGMFPRQFPSRWLDRRTVVKNDNRPYADSPLWAVDALLMYLRETGDVSILQERVPAVHLTDQDHPETSGIVGAETSLSVVEVLFEIFAAYHRHAMDSPYHLAQILFGDWCDPVDMYGTSVVGDPATRGQGRGAQVRLSAHLCICLVNSIDTLSAQKVRESLKGIDLQAPIEEWKQFASQLRKDILRVAWEDGPDSFQAGFVDCIHEYKLDGSVPDYAAGQTGYTLGSMKGRDFDGVERRLLTTQAYGLEMLRLQRDYLDGIPGAEEMIRKLLKSVDSLFHHPQLGLLLFSKPVASNPHSVRLVGRLGIVPPGCAENGEYHHAQMFMHTFRLGLEGQEEKAWEQFEPVLSVSHAEDIGGPFDMTSNSFVSDPDDPHFGKGMYFGLSGSVDWMVELFQKIAGVELALHDDRQPALVIHPRLPSQFKESFKFQRIVHQALPECGYRSIPLTVEFMRTGNGDALKDTVLLLNGKPQEKMEVQTLGDIEQIHFQVSYVYG